MRKRIKFWQCFALSLVLYFFAQVAYAAAFTATVEDNAITFGQGIQLRLRLEGAAAVEPINLSALAKDFMIYNQQQYSSYSNNNGQVSSDIGWNVTLMPKKSGEVMIPAVSLETDHGRLVSLPIKIQVDAPGTGDKRPDDALGISLISSVNKAKAYVNEPVIYTLKIISYKPVANIVLDDIKSNEAIVEKIGEPKQYDQSLGGVMAHIIEIRYAVTALKPGKVVINPALMHGELQVPQQAQKPQRFGIFNNIFLNNMFELKPFSLQSEEISLDIAPAVIKNSAWLPVRDLTITEQWEGLANAQVGDAITRKIKLTAKGAFAKQLPSVKEYVQLENIKIYVSKPVTNDKFDADTGTLTGTKEEEYSIVPQAAGKITFPEIKIKWWNVLTNKPEVSIMPAKTIQIAQAANDAAGKTVDYSDTPVKADVAQQAQATAQTQPTALYAIIGVLLGIILTLAGILVYFIIRKRAPNKTKDADTQSVRVRDADIVIVTAVDLRDHMLQYAIKHWHLPKELTLNRLGDLLAANNYMYDIAMYTTLSKHLNATIYANSAMELALLQDQWQAFKNSVVKNKRKVQRSLNSTDYSSLNPT